MLPVKAGSDRWAGGGRGGGHLPRPEAQVLNSVLFVTPLPRGLGPSTRSSLFVVLFRKTGTQRRCRTNQRRGAWPAWKSALRIWACPRPPGPAPLPGEPLGPDPERRGSPPGQKSHKEPGRREGDEISGCPIPPLPREQQPSTLCPSLLFSNHFILLLFEALACFLSHF